MRSNIPKSWTTRLDKLTHTCGCNHCEGAPPEVSRFVADLNDVYQANNMLQVMRLLNEHTFTLDEAAEKLTRMMELDGESRHDTASAALTSKDRHK